MLRHAHQRSGVILLIILALLALFTLLGLGLVIITSQARLAGQQAARIERVGDLPQDEERMHNLREALKLWTRFS